MNDQKKSEALSDVQAAEMAASVPDWTLADGVLSREFKFGDFVESMVFVNRVAKLAEEQDHHPDIDISYDHVRLDLSTHTVGGLTEKDFALALAVERLL